MREEAAGEIARYLPQRRDVRPESLTRNLRQRDDGRWEWKHGFGRRLRAADDSLVPGAQVFGAAMQVADGCGSGSLYEAGMGNGFALAVRPGFVAGCFVGAVHLDRWLALVSLPPVSPVEALGAGGALAVFAVLDLIVAAQPWAIVYRLGPWGTKIATRAGRDLATKAFRHRPEQQAQIAAPLLDVPTWVSDFGLLVGAPIALLQRGTFAPHVQATGAVSRGGDQRARAWLQRAHHAHQALAHLGGDLRQLWARRELLHRIRVHELDVNRAVVVLPDDDVARQQQPDGRLRLQRPPRIRRVAGAEDLVRRDVVVELLLHRRLDVDLGQHAEALLLQLRGHPLERLLVAHGDGPAETIRILHGQLLCICGSWKCTPVAPAATVMRDTDDLATAENSREESMAEAHFPRWSRKTFGVIVLHALPGPDGISIALAAGGVGACCRRVGFNSTRIGPVVSACPLCLGGPNHGLRRPINSPRRHGSHGEGQRRRCERFMPKQCMSNARLTPE